MERVIVDTYVKGEKHTWDLDKDNPRNQEFNRKILAVNDMYGWLYEQGILGKVSFEFKDYSDVSYFAIDTKDLAPYRDMMLRSGLKDAALAVEHIFDVEYTPCLYSGAIQLGWTMNTYRDVDGCVGRSWECGLIQSLGTNAIVTVEQVLEDKGVRAAVEALFDECAFVPDDLVTVRALTEEDTEQVYVLDWLAGCAVADFLDSEEYAWGVFVKDELVGYCTLGGADDPETGYSRCKGWTDSSLVLCDVFIKEGHRGKGLALRLVDETLKKGNPENESVFLTLIDDQLVGLYEKAGFQLVGNGVMVRDELPCLEAAIKQARDERADSMRFDIGEKDAIASLSKGNTSTNHDRAR